MKQHRDWCALNEGERTGECDCGFAEIANLQHLLSQWVEAWDSGQIVGNWRGRKGIDIPLDESRKAIE